MLHLLTLTLCGVCALSVRGASEERLVWKGKGDAPQWILSDIVANMTDYMDITDFRSPKVQPSTLLTARRMAQDPYPTETRYVGLARAMLNRAESTPQNLIDLLFPLTAFFNRYYIGPYGKESAASIFTTISEWIARSGRNDVSVRVFPHEWEQFSVIARFEGSSSNDAAVVIGSHQDSINLDVPLEERPFSRAPGADDDGSGSVSTMEAFRVLLENDFRPTRPVEFQWYAAEEVGLLGSQDIATAYSAEDIPIHAMLQIDMCGGLPGSNVGAIIMDDFSPPDLSNYLALVFDAHVSLNGSVTYGVCGACSDHVSFSRVGYPAIFPIESEGVGFGHTANDLPGDLDYVYMFEYVKLVMGFVLELAHP